MVLTSLTSRDNVQPISNIELWECHIHSQWLGLGVLAYEYNVKQYIMIIPLVMYIDFSHISILFSIPH